MPHLKDAGSARAEGTGRPGAASMSFSVDPMDSSLESASQQDDYVDAVSSSTCSTRWKKPSNNPTRPTATTVADGNSLISNSAISRWAVASSEFVASDR